MYELEKARYLARLVRQNPWELLRLLSWGMTTFKYRYVRRCAGRGTLVGPHTTIINAANVRIGEKCWLQDHVYIRAGTQGRVELGARVAVNSFVRIFGHGSVWIGDDVQVGPGTLITTTGHEYDGDLEAQFQPVRIGRRAWIGANVTILPGVQVGECAVVGAGSVVTKDIPSHCVAVGVPARVVKRTSPNVGAAQPAPSS